MRAGKRCDGFPHARQLKEKQIVVLRYGLCNVLPYIYTIEESVKVNVILSNWNLNADDVRWTMYIYFFFQGECEEGLIKLTMPALAPKPRDGYALGPPPQLPAQDRPRQNHSETWSMQNVKYSTEPGTGLWNFLFLTFQLGNRWKSSRQRMEALLT